jgi:hypothetical protein
LQHMALVMVTATRVNQNSGAASTLEPSGTDLAV